MRKIFTASMLLLLFSYSCSFAAGVKTQPQSQSQSERISIFDDVRPSPVRRPGKMHVGGKNSDDVSLSVGDVKINPIPNLGR